jgi:hypothetical protein
MSAAAAAHDSRKRRLPLHQLASVPTRNSIGTVRSLRGRIVKVTDTQLLSDEDDVRLLENGNAQSFQFADDAQVAPPLIEPRGPLGPPKCAGGTCLFSGGVFSGGAPKSTSATSRVPRLRRRHSKPRRSVQAPRGAAPIHDASTQPHDTLTSRNDAASVVSVRTRGRTPRSERLSNATVRILRDDPASLRVGRDRTLTNRS